MIWQSIPIMTVFDILILGIVGYAAFGFLRDRRRPARGSEAGSLAILAGLSLVALFYLADLLVMHAFPAFIPRAEAMAIMGELHQNASWLVALFGVGMISLGFNAVNQAKVALLEGLESRDRQLGRELAIREAAEIALRDSEERFRDFAESASDWFWELDADLRFTFVSSGATRVTGYTNDTLIGHRRWDVVTDLADAQLWEPHRADMEARRPIRGFRYPIATADGERRYVSISGDPVFDEKGQFKGYRGASRDVTAEIEAKKTLEESERRLAWATRVAKVGYWGWDEVEDKLLFASKDFLDIVGLDSEQAFRDRFPNRAAFLSQFHPEDRDEVTQAIKKHLESKQDHAGQHRIVRPDGEVRYVYFATERSLNADGALVQTTGVTQDLTERVRAEVALEEERSFNATILDTADALIVVLDRNGRITAFNKKCEELTGYRADEVRQKCLWDFLLSPEDAAVIKERFSLLDKEGVRGQRDNYWITKSGKRRLISWRNSSITAPSGSINFIVSIGIDVTDLKQTEAQLHESEARFRDIARASGDWFWEIDENRRFTYLSARYQEVTGTDPADLLGKNLLELGEERGQPEIYRKAFEDAAKQFRAREPYRDIRLDLVTRDNRPRHWRVSGVPVFDENGTFKGYRGATTDITEEVKTEQRLRDSEGWLRQAAELARFGSWVWDVVDDVCIYASESLPSLLGMTREEFFRHGATSRDALSHVHPNDREAYRTEFEKLKTGQRIEFEYRIVTKTGEIRHGREIAVPVLDEAGRPFRETGTYQDITELKQAEEKLHQAQKMEAVGQLTGGVAHDFNNLLAIIQGNAELLAGKAEHDNRLLQAIIRASQRGAKLTHRLLAFSRKQTLDPRALDLNASIEGMTEMLRRTLGASIEIEVVGDAGLWQCEVDPGQLENTILNLAINARDAMPAGGKLTIETSNARLDDEGAAAQAEVTPGHYVMLAISDSGSGMAPEVVERIFEPFFTTKDVGKGSGLGLAMIYGFVKQSQGHVTVSSEEGVGTTFKLYLPRYRGDEKAGHDRPATGAIERGQGEVVLVVEDDADLRTLSVSLLQSLGYKVLEARDGRSALECLDGSPRINLLLTDVVLPGGMNGRELAEETENRHPGLPVLYMSGHTDDAILHHSRLDKGVGLLQKPFGKSVLAHTVSKALSGG